MSEKLLARLEVLKNTGPGRYVARCPAHADRTPSLSIRVLDNGRTLIHCFAGCDVADIVAALGLTISDLMQERIGHHFRPERQPFDARQVLDGVSHEVAIIAVLAEDIVAGEPMTEIMRDRLFVAAGRLSAALIFAPFLTEPPEFKVIRSGERPS